MLISFLFDFSSLSFGDYIEALMQFELHTAKVYLRMMLLVRFFFYIFQSSNSLYLIKNRTDSLKFVLVNFNDILAKYIDSPSNLF